MTTFPPTSQPQTECEWQQGADGKRRCMRKKIEVVEFPDAPHGHCKKADADQAISQRRADGFGSIAGGRDFGLYALVINVVQCDTMAKASDMAAMSPPYASQTRYRLKSQTQYKFQCDMALVIAGSEILLWEICTALIFATLF